MKKVVVKKKAVKTIKNNGPLESNNPNVILEGKEVKKEPPPDADEVMEKINAMGTQMRELILLCKKVPRIDGLDPHQEQVRSLALAQAHLQTGFLWLRRGVKPDKLF